MKRFLTVCIALTSQVLLFAQDDEYYPILNENLSWQIRYFAGFEELPSGAGHFFLGSDTVIGGHLYSRLLGHPTYATDDSPYPNYITDPSLTLETNLFMREDVESRTVYMYDIEDSLDKLMYDFSLEVGDTLFSEFSQGEFVITQVDTITLLNGEHRKMFYSNVGVPYIESIGGINGIQEQIWYPLSGGFSSLECVRIGSELIWSEGASGSCIGFLSTNDRTSLEQTVSLFPNPAIEEIWLEIENLKGSINYQVIDFLGKKWDEGRIVHPSQTIDISTLPVGVYLIQLSNIQGIVSSKKIVKTSK